MVLTKHCRLCGSSLLDFEPMVGISHHTVCSSCAWRVVIGLGKVYNAPEITALERMRHRQKNGIAGHRKAPLPDQPGWVYYIRMGDTIKIGYATDVAKRMRAYPPTAELLAAHPGTTQTERDMHKRFAGDLAQGREWFNPSDDLLAHVSSVVEQFGDASGLAYEYTRPKTQEERVRAFFDRVTLDQVPAGVHDATR